MKRLAGGYRQSHRPVCFLLGAIFLLIASCAPVWERALVVVPETPITAMDQTVAPANNSPALLADPTDPRFVVMANRLDAPDYSCALFASGDSGRNWTQVQSFIQLPPGAEKCYAPEISFDERGVLYYLFVGLAGKGNLPMGAFLTKSFDRAGTFTKPVRVLGPLNFAVRMAIDPAAAGGGRIHLVWIKAREEPGLGSMPAPPNPIMSAHSDDGGRTFTPPVQVSDPRRSLVVAPALAVGSEHTVEVAYYDLMSDRIDYHGLEGSVWPDPWTIAFAHSDDGGRSFEPRASVDNKVGPPGRVMLIFTMPPPSLVADGKTICAAWADARYGDPDILARCSTDEGLHWQSPRRVNDDRKGSGTVQLLPRLGISPNGRLDVIFYDRRGDREGLSSHVYYAYSGDKRSTFARNRRITRDPSDSRIGQRYGGAAARRQVEFGSRLGLLSRDDSLIAAWADTRNSRDQTTGQDVFTAEVAFNRSRGSLVLALGAAALLGIATFVVIRAARKSTPTDDHQQLKQ